jgi:hypothetical protein
MRATSQLPVWVKAVRLLGACIGLILISLNLSGGLPSAQINWSYRDYVACLNTLLGVLLILRWSFFRLASTLNFILYAFIFCLALLLPHYVLAFTHTLGKSNLSGAEKIVFSLLEVALVLILFAQIPSLWVIRRQSTAAR